MEIKQTSKQLKVLPFACTKSELVDMYLDQMSQSYIIRQINVIIIDNRRLDGRKTPKTSKVFHKELTEFVEIHGLPKGYYIEEPK